MEIRTERDDPNKRFIGTIITKLKNVKETISIMNKKIGSPCRKIYRVGGK